MRFLTNRAAKHKKARDLELGTGLERSLPTDAGHTNDGPCHAKSIRTMVT